MLKQSDVAATCAIAHRATDPPLLKRPGAQNLNFSEM
jgi:hypothetical protein